MLKKISVNHLIFSFSIFSIVFIFIYTLQLSSIVYNKYNILDYGLSYRRVKMEKEDELTYSLDEIIDLNVDDDVTIIAPDVSKGAWGVYDPRYYMFNGSMYFQRIGERYFSPNDYLKGKKVLVKISDDYDNVGEQVELEIGSFNHIMSISPSNFNEKVDYFVNLSSLEDVGKKIYIDADDYETINNVVSKFEKKGYKSVGNDMFKEIRHWTKNIINLSIIVFVLLIPLVLFVLFILAFYFYLRTRTKNILLAKTYGASLKKVANDELKYFFLSWIGAVGLAILAANIIFIDIFKKLQFFEVIFLSLSILFIAIFISLIEFMIIWKWSKHSKMEELR